MLPKFGKVKKLTKGGAIIPINHDLIAKITKEFNIDSCLEIFNELPRIRGELTTLREPKCYAGVFIKDDLPYRIVNYENLFDSPTFNIYNFNSANYSKLTKCLSYSLYRIFDFDYSISMLLNLIQTCNFLKDSHSDLLVRLYISHNLFLLKPDETHGDKLIYVLTILDELLKFPFFELHQVFIENLHSISLIPEIIEKQRLFRFMALVDPTIDACYSKDIDSIITETEIEAFERFFHDDRFLISYYNYYQLFHNNSTVIKNAIYTDFLNIEKYDDDFFEIMEQFQDKPEWFAIYQNAFPKPMLKHKIPAGLFMVKRGVITIDKFRETYELLVSNYHKIKVFLFNLIGKISNHSGEPTKRNKYSYDLERLIIKYDLYKIERRLLPPIFPEPTDDDFRNFEILKNLHYSGSIYLNYYVSTLETLNNGFDENFLSNLINFIPDERIKELGISEELLPFINEIKTTFELKPIGIDYFPIH